jgi:hypothetical protein
VGVLQTLSEKPTHKKSLRAAKRQGFKETHTSA